MLSGFTRFPRAVQAYTRRFYSGLTLLALGHGCIAYLRNLSNTFPWMRTRPACAVWRIASDLGDPQTRLL